MLVVFLNFDFALELLLCIKNFTYSLLTSWLFPTKSPFHRCW